MLVAAVEIRPYSKLVQFGLKLMIVYSVVESALQFNH